MLPRPSDDPYVPVLLHSPSSSADLLAPAAMCCGHAAALNVVEREVVVVVDCKHGHNCSKLRKCGTCLLLCVHPADGIQVASVAVDVVAEQHQGVGEFMEGDVLQQRVPDVHALRDRKKEGGACHILSKYKREEAQGA